MTPHPSGRWLGLILSCLVAAAALGQPDKPAAYVEDSPAAQELFDRAQALREQGRPQEAAQAFQRVIDEYPQKLMLVREGLYTDARQRVLAELMADPALLEAYRRAMGASAERALERAMSPAPDPAGLREVMARYGLTAPGLLAGLNLAALSLERAAIGDAAAALDELDSHPDLEQHQARWHYLQAAAGLFGHDRAQLERHLAGLRQVEARDELAAVLEWSKQSAPPPATAAAAAPEPSLPEQIGRPLWTLTMPEPGGEVYREVAAQLRDFEDPQSSMLRPLPSAAGDDVYINTGATIAAVNRHSGRILWAFHPSTDAESDPIGYFNWLRIGARVPDQRSVLVVDDLAVAVAGFALPPVTIARPDGLDTSLVCLSRRDGQVLWRIGPGDVDPALAGTFFHGTPVARGDTVYVLLRRGQMSGFHDAYLAAVDLRSGRPIWRRYLTSAAGGSQFTQRWLGQMTLEGDRLYVADNLSAVSCLDARSGNMLWLRLLAEGPEGWSPAPMPGRRSFTMPSPPPAPAPLLVKAGLLVPPLSGARALLLDPRTGEALPPPPAGEGAAGEAAENAWSDGDYFIPAGADVLSVGPTVRLIDGETLRQLWARELGGGATGQPLGMAAVTPRQVAIPLPDRIVVLDLRDGTIAGEHAVGAAGNLLALEGELIAADGLTVQAFMQWAMAYDYLRRQVADHPDDPQPALAMAHLALSAGEWDALLEGVDHAVAALRRAEPPAEDEPAAPQAEVFRQLLDFAESPAVRSASVRRALFDRLATTTAGPADEVHYQLALGQFHAAEGKLDEAVDRYQAVLLDPVLASQLHERGPATRQAGIEARMRLERLIHQGGRGLYERYETDAARRLQELTRGGTGDPERLLELIRQYPLAAAVMPARVAAAEALLRAAKPSAAAAQLRLAYQQSPPPELLPRVVGLLTQVYAQTGRPRLAMSFLEQAHRSHPGLRPLRDGQPVSVDTWLADLARQPAGELRLPALRLPLAQPRVIGGRMLLPEAQPAEAWARDRVLVLEGEALRLRAGPELSARWEVRLGEGDPRLLALSREQAVIFMRGPDRLHVLDGETGKPVMPPLDAAKLVSEVGDEAPAALGPMDQRLRHAAEQRGGRIMVNRQPIHVGQARPRAAGPVARRVPPGYHLQLSESVLVVADRAGRVVGLDRDTGRVLWRRRTSVDELTHALLGPDALVLAGATGVPGGVESGSVLVLDPQTGEPRLPAVEERSPIYWVGLSGDGLVLHLGGTDLVARSLTDGALAWRLSRGAEVATGEAAVGDGLLLLAEEGGTVLVIDAATGETRSRVSTGSTPGPTGQIQVQAADQQWQVLTRDAAVAVGPDGGTRWIDAIAETDKRLQAQLVGERHVALVGLARTPQAANLEWLDNGRQVVVRGPDGVMRRVGPPDDLAPIVNEEPPVAEVERLREMAVGQLAPPAGEWLYKLYVLERDSGVLVEERDLGPLTEPLDAGRALLLDNQVLLGTSSGIVVVPGSAEGGSAN